MESVKGLERQYDAIVFGWPKYPSGQEQDTLNLLIHRPEAVIVLSEDAEPQLQGWVAKRAHSAFLYWNDYGDIINVFHRIKISKVDNKKTRTLSDRVRIMLVDDSKSVRVYYKRLLERNGYQVKVAENVNDALKLARSDSFDIAIIDYFMPGANGDILCRALRDDLRTSSITTAIFTGTYLDNVIQESLEAGAVECMFKNEADELFLTRINAMTRLIAARKSVDMERRRLESILSSVGEGVYGVNLDGTISFVNPAAKRILGFDDDEVLIGRSPHELFHFADEQGEEVPRHKCVLDQAYVSGKELRGWETVFWGSEKKPISIDCTVFPLIIENERKGSVIAFRDITERKNMENKLRWQATHDPLTKLSNRRYFEEQIVKEVARLKRSAELSALLYIDLDRFKYINDTAGHAAGDKLLIEVAEQLKTRLREADILSRLGGDEFAVLLRNIDLENVSNIADGFRKVLDNYDFNFEGKVYKVNGSIGVALIGHDTQSPGEVMSNADIACHLAKSKGRNQTHVYINTQDEKSVMDMELGWSSRLRDALQNDGFILNYQPIISLNDLDVEHLPMGGDLWEQINLMHIPKHFEVLIRFPGPNGELVSPNAFIPTAERFNMMQEIDQWVIENALKQIANMAKQGRKATFAINLSGQSMSNEMLAEQIKRLIIHYEIDPELLIFEITETSAIENLENAIKVMDDLHLYGCRFSLDDFGTGFSSFSQLKYLPVDFVKIDGSFVQGVSRDGIDKTMVSSINDIAHSLKRFTIAEYVESPDVLKVLKECGVDYVQGFYISEPLPNIMGQNHAPGLEARH